MEIRILSAGKELGPYTETQVRQYLGEGLVAPSDLATCDGKPDWQALDQILAELPPDPVPRETFTNMQENVPQESTSPSSAPKTRRNPIVMQPVFAPNDSTVSGQKRPRSGKTALMIEPPRPTTQLPPVAKFVPKQEDSKIGKPIIRTGPLSPANFFERPATAPETVPNVPTTPPEPLEESLLATEAPPTPTPDIPPALLTEESPEMSQAIIYAGVGLVLLIGVVLLAFAYFFLFAHHDAVPAAPSNPSTQTLTQNSAQVSVSSTDSNTSADFSARGLSKQTQGDLDGALADYDRALDLDPNDLQACYRRAVVRQTKGNWNGALTDYNALINANPRNADAFSNRGFVKQALGDSDGALADYVQALMLNPKIPVAYYNEGLIKVQKGDLDGAIDAYNHALDLDPKMAIAYYNRGNAKNTEGNLDGAIADYTQAITLNPNIALAFCNRGFARQSKGESDGALADYSQAILLNPKMPVAFYNRGLIKVQRGDLDGAIADSARAIDLDPKNAQAFCNRGLAQFGKGDLDGAAADLNKFCELAPRDTGVDSARLYLWIIATKQNPKGTADQDLATALQNEWNTSPEDLSSKVAAFLLGHIRENELIADAASPDPSREPGQYCKVWYFAGMKRLLAGNTTTAAADFQKSLGTDQKDYCEYLFARAELVNLGQIRQASAQNAVPVTP